jgi:hypothetical protein
MTRSSTSTAGQSLPNHHKTFFPLLSAENFSRIILGTVFRIEMMCYSQLVREFALAMVV